VAKDTIKISNVISVKETAILVLW